MSLTMTCRMTAKTMSTVSAVPAARAPAGTPSAPACEEYALNLPAIETYIGHSIPVSKYNPDALMTDLPKPLRLTRTRPVMARAVMARLVIVVAQVNIYAIHEIFFRMRHGDYPGQRSPVDTGAA